MIANDDSPFDGMDIDLLKELRKRAHAVNRKNLSIPADTSEPRGYKCIVCGDPLTVVDFDKCRQCVLAERMK